MALFGKDPEYLEVVAADFLPDGNKLYMIVADSDCNLHVLQYDPEGTKSPQNYHDHKPPIKLTNPQSRSQILQRRPPPKPQ